MTSISVIAINDSVILRHVPSIRENISGISTGDFADECDLEDNVSDTGVIVFGSSTGESSSSGTVSSYSPPAVKKIDLSQMIITPISELEKELVNTDNPPELIEHLNVFSEMKGLLEVGNLTDYVN